MTGGGFLFTCITMNPFKALRRDIIYKEVTVEDLSKVDEVINFLEKCSPGRRVETEYDWKMVEILWKFLNYHQPAAFESWRREIAMEKEAYRNNPHRVGEQGDHYLQHTLTVPEVFYTFMKRFFPNQDVAHPNFVKRFIDVIPEARTSDRQHKI